MKGTLYGTTEFGGKHNRGTIFSITTAGVEKVLHSFGKRSDGSQPLAQLVHVGSTLYGTTSSGGAYTCGRYRCGTVFSITTGGMEKVLHSFNGTDGQGPAAGLLDVSGTPYGTTSKGGAYTCAAATCGTVFRITTRGAEKVLHSFAGSSDGALPLAGPIKANGALYGTTSLGGGSGCSGNGCGTVFSMSP
ncbi:MAG: choice-of-anchor tandem repeat GloVer-containing protein [Candidatus Cybelea sp.]